MGPGELLPKRNPGLISRIFSAVTRQNPSLGPQPTQQDSTQSSVSAEAGRTIWDKYFLTQNDRRAVYQDVDEMDASSEEASVALDTIADNVNASEDGSMTSFRAVSKNDRVQEVLDQICHDTKLHHKSYAMTRSALKYGDLFAEIVVNGDGEVVDVRMVTPANMLRNEDPNGNLKLAKPQYDETGKCINNQGECAFEQIDGENQEILATFYPWQMIHGKWNHDGYSMYGRSLLRVSRIIWKKLKAEEEALILGRLIRAMMKLVFYVDTTGLSQTEKQIALQNFRQNILNRTQIDGKREQPFSVLTDFFLTKENFKYGGQVVQSQTRVEAIDPKNDGLVEIDDVKHFHRKFLATLRVPPSYMGFDTAEGDTVTMQDIQYSRFIRRAQQFMGHHLRQVFDLGLILADLDPREEDNEYDIQWPTLSTTDEAAQADAQYKLAQAMSIALGTSSLNQTPYLSREYVLKHIYALSDDEIQTVLSEVDDYRQERMAEEQQQADAESQRAMAVAKANATAKQPQNPDQASGRINMVHNHDQQADPAKAKNGSSTAAKTTQELDILSVLGIVGDEISPALHRLSKDHGVLLAETRDLRKEILNGNS